MVKTIAEKFGVNRRTVRENIAKFADEIKAAYEREVDISKLADTECIKALEKENKKLRAELSKSDLQREATLRTMHRPRGLTAPSRTSC